MIELTGFDHTNNRGFKKLFFEEKKGGGRTQNAMVADTIQKDDWVEVTMDDTQYKNVQQIRKISEPAGSNVPDSTQGSGKSSGGGGKSTMSKEEWALKDAKKALSMARHKAIQCASDILPEGAPTKKIVDAMEKLAKRFTAYILTGDFDGEVVEPVLEKPVAQTDNTPATDNKEDDSMAANPEGEGAGGAPTDGQDDDIPF